MYEQTARTTARRSRDRMSYERATAHAILDEAYYCHLSFVVDGEPRTLPTLHVRVGETVYVHGSTGSGPLLAAWGLHGLPVCLTVTHLDGIVFGRSHFHHSANYRSVVAHGVARLVTDDADKRRVLTALVEKIAPGRAADSRPPTRKELAQTSLLALPLLEVSVKARVGGVIDDPEDYGLPFWAGVVPLRLVPGPPQPDAGVTRPTPDYLRRDATVTMDATASLPEVRRAFEEHSAVRVEWRVDARDAQARRAIEALGATSEGVLRRHRRLPDGAWGDTVIYAITADEWCPA